MPLSFTQVTDFNYVAALALLCDVLPIVSQLSRRFQGDALNFSQVSNQLITNSQSGQTGIIYSDLILERF